MFWSLLHDGFLIWVVRIDKRSGGVFINVLSFMCHDELDNCLKGTLNLMQAMNMCKLPNTVCRLVFISAPRWRYKDGYKPMSKDVTPKRTSPLDKSACSQHLCTLIRSEVWEIRKLMNRSTQSYNSFPPQTITNLVGSRVSCQCCPLPAVVISEKDYRLCSLWGLIDSNNTYIAPPLT